MLVSHTENAPAVSETDKKGDLFTFLKQDARLLCTVTCHLWVHCNLITFIGQVVNPVLEAMA